MRKVGEGRVGIAHHRVHTALAVGRAHPTPEGGCIMTYCTDLDLLHDEPNLFRDASAAAQLLMSGTGTLAGSSLTIAAGSFIAEHVAVGGVVVLEAAPLGSYGIIAVNSATQLTISALYEGLFPTDGSP